ncbi:MAG: hypothetical protein M1832_004298 [Thelocarpon impressellum]|nr:MAG: hypothetical protein M1832_004298 [Thelocarpon impressellum]
MAPSEVSANNAVDQPPAPIPAHNQRRESTTTTVNTSADLSAAVSKAQPQGKPMANGEGKTFKDGAAGEKAGAGGAGQAEKPSGAELKKKAKAEKQARRERERLAQEKQSGGGSGPQKDGGKDDGGKHKITTSTAAGDAQKALLVRGHSGGGGKGGAANPSAAASKPTASSSAPRKGGDKQVALFGHLYGHARRTSITGASKEVHPAVLALGLQIGNYVVCGSNARCVASLLVFKKVIESYTTPHGTTLTRHLPAHLSLQIDFLVSCRPLSVSMGNAIRWLKLEISAVDISVRDADAKATLCAAIDNFIRERITVADQVIATSAGAKIRDGDVILTYAKSSIVQQTLASAHARGVRFRVVVVDSRPLFEGRHLARSLAALGLEVQYSLMHGVGHAVKDATKVLLGAHAMMSNGCLYSRVGSAAVAMVATEADVPVIVCCESVKFTEKVALDSIVTNEVAPPDEFVGAAAGGAAVDGGGPLAAWRDTPNLQLLNLMYDVTPAEYINMVITEYGSLPPSSVPVVYRLSTNS